MHHPIAWGAHVPLPFLEKVVLICGSFGWYENAESDLLSCIAFESGETFAPDVRNAAGSGAVGLIQFMPATAIRLKTTTEQLAAMSAVEQLDYVEMYFAPYAERIHSLSDMYMAILLPKYVGHPDGAVLFSAGIAYRQNSGLDANHDGKITKGEAAARVAAMKAKGLRPGYVLG